MAKRIIIMNFDIESKSYQAFSEIKRCVQKDSLKVSKWRLLRMLMMASINLKSMILSILQATIIHQKIA